MRNPIERLTRPAARAWRGRTIDWVVTIVGAIAIVLAIKAWVVNPYRIPSSSMEPTLHCAAPGRGCQARFSDRVLANRFIYHFREPHRGDIIVFKTPPRAEQQLRRRAGTFVKRIDRPPRGDVGGAERLRLHQRQEADRAVHQAATAATPRRRTRRGRSPPGTYFMMGDNRDPVLRLARAGGRCRAGT